MAKNLQLNGMIHEKYANEAELAKHLGWSKQRLNRITTGKKDPSLTEVNDIARALGTTFVIVGKIFLGEESTIVDEMPKKIDPIYFLSDRHNKSKKQEELKNG